MNKQSYKQQAPNSYAVRVAHSWLRAVGIKARDSSKPGCDIAIRCADGSTADVAILMSFDDVEIPDEALVVLASEIGSPKLDIAFESFHVLTEETGHGRPIPVDRGERKRVYGDDFFLVAARHTELHRSPDMPKEKREQYAPLVGRACRAFFAKNVKLCGLTGYELQDLETYAWCWANIFCHSWEIRVPTNDQGYDNERLFTKYMRDQFYHLFLQLEACKKVHFDMQIVDAAQPPVLDLASDPESPYFLEDDTKEVSLARRRRAAAKILKGNLDGLPHDTMVERLSDAIGSRFRDHETKRVARSILRNHTKECKTCLKVQAPVTGD